MPKILTCDRCGKGEDESFVSEIYLGEYLGIGEDDNILAEAVVCAACQQWLVNMVNNWEQTRKGKKG